MLSVEVNRRERVTPSQLRQSHALFLSGQQRGQLIQTENIGSLWILSDMELIDCLMFLKKKKGSRDLENDRKSVRQNLDVEHKANFRGSKVNQDKMAWPRPNGESTGKVYARLWRAAGCITVKG